MRRKHNKAFRRDAEHSAKMGQKSREAVLDAYAVQNMGDKLVQMEAISNTTILFFMALREEYGFGKTRLGRVFDKMAYFAAALREGQGTIQDIEDVLKEEADLVMPHAEFPMKSRYQRIEKATFEDTSCIFLFAVHDEFGFCVKRLGRIYDRVAEYAKRLPSGEVSIDRLEKKLAKDAGITFDHTFGQKPATA